MKKRNSNPFIFLSIASVISFCVILILEVSGSSMGKMETYNFCTLNKNSLVQTNDCMVGDYIYPVGNCVSINSDYWSDNNVEKVVCTGISAEPIK